MADPQLILCGGVAKPRLPASWRRAEQTPLAIGRGSGDVHLQINELSRSLSARIPAEALDLIELAAYVYVADQIVTRGGKKEFEYGQKWCRQWRFEVPVRCPDLWNRSDVQDALNGALEFLTDDQYEFGFRRAENPAPPDQYLPDILDPSGDEFEEVMLFSGGLDSLCGAIEEVVQGQRRTVLVSHRPVSTTFARQRALVAAIHQRVPDALKRPLHVPVKVNKGKSLNREFTQRSRPFLFAAIASVVARVFNRPRIRFYENGVTSFNLPVSPSVIGGRASRTTHPQTLFRFGKLFSLLFDTPFQVENPYQWDTKAQILKRVHAAGHSDLFAQSCSCAHPWGRTTRQPHCGRCSQCVDRRLSVLAAGLNDQHDPPGGYEHDVLRAERHGADLTFAERYYATALELEAMDLPRIFATRFGELNHALHYTGLNTEESLSRTHQLFREHADGVRRAVTGVIGTNAEDLYRQAYPPFSLLGVVVGRCQTTSGAAPSPSRNGSAHHGFVVDHDRFEVRLGDKSCVLGNTREFRLIDRLSRSRKSFLSITTLGQDVWDNPEVSKNAVQRTVSNLRRKLRDSLSPSLDIDGRQPGHYLLVLPPS